MVRIERLGSKPRLVAKSAYEGYFKHFGWTITGSASSVPTPDTNQGSEHDEWEEVDQEYEKPIGEMDIEELRAKAAEMGLDITGLSTPKQIRDKIRKNM